MKLYSDLFNNKFKNVVQTSLESENIKFEHTSIKGIGVDIKRWRFFAISSCATKNEIFLWVKNHPFGKLLQPPLKK